jgi:hypothetical protein
VATDEEVRFRNPVKALGFAQIPHVVTRDQRISDGAYRLYAIYLSYAMQKDACWPNQQTLADHLQVDVRTVRRYNQELVDAGYINRQRRLGAASITWIEDLETNPVCHEIALRILEGRNVPSNGTKMSSRTTQNCPVEGEPEKDNQEEEPVTPPEWFHAAPTQAAATEFLRKQPDFHPAPKPGAFRPEPVHVEVDENGDEISGGKLKRPKSQLPDNPFHERLLEASHAKYFQPNQKPKAKAIHKALQAGELIGDDVQMYERCLVAARACGEKDVPQVMPWSWFGWREEQARQHHWSVWGFLNALMDADALAKHCLFQLRAKRVVGGQNGEQRDAGDGNTVAGGSGPQAGVDDYTAQLLRWQAGQTGASGRDDETAGLDLP